MNKQLTVRVPASSANLGPGFDALALAYQLYCTLTFELKENGTTNGGGPEITIKGTDAAALPLNSDNLVMQVLEKHFPELKPQFKNLKVTIDSDIPLSRGLGSSAACIAATVWAGMYFSGQNPDRKSALQIAAAIEGHPDNVSASIFGGLVASACVKQPPSYMAANLEWPADWHPILVVPDREVSTAHARSVLPKMVSMAEAVSNIQNTALLLMAIEKKDTELLKAGLSDCLHEPHRQSLVPELQEVKDLLKDSPALGVVLSGAGSSVLVLSEARNVAVVKSLLENWAMSQKGTVRILSLEVDREGLRASHE
ncbi:MAG: homoserine kinase [Candidatus Melainabacteria bacterium]|nr:homoserine kinase [Candidatus Melainabacteria bacterium]